MNIKKVAEAAGVSITTVSRVLNSPDMVSEETRNKVLSTMEKLNYTPNWFARNLQKTRTNVIGVIIPDTGEETNMEIAKGAGRVAQQKGSNIILCNTEYDRDVEKKSIRALMDRKIDGLIIASSLLDAKELEMISDRDIPFVLVGRSDLKDEKNIVYTNYEEAAEEAVNHLASIGREKIAIVLAQKPPIENEDKLRGYRHALEKNGLILREEYIERADNTIEGGYLATGKLLDLKERPDAVFFATDTMAFGGIECLKQAEICTDDMGIVGFGDMPVSAVMEPKLTTVTRPSYRMGLTAARLLFDMIEEPGLETQAIMLQSKLKIRRSCGNKKRLMEIW